MKTTLLDASRYKKFTADRDRELCQIEQHFQTDLSRALYPALTQIENLAASLSIRTNGNFRNAPSLSRNFENGCDSILMSVYQQMLTLFQKMRKATFILTYASEHEAIGQATQRRSSVTAHEFQAKLKQSLSAPSSVGNAKIEHRIWFNLHKLRSKIVKSFTLAVIQEMKPEEIVDAVKGAFPRVTVYKNPPRALKPIRESQAKPRKNFYSYDFISDEDWDEAEDYYIETQLPPSRFDNENKSADDDQPRYNWEMEQEATQDFIDQVRSGENDAAKDLGIEEFVWVAIVDDKTDDCCLGRNGLTTAEIRGAMEAGNLDDDCDADTAPAHFNCRCKMAPVASADQVEGPDWNNFNEWLAS